MKYKSPIARYLHKRISHYYKQTDKEHPYIIKLSTLFNDSGNTMEANMTKNKQRIESALNELLEEKTIVNFKLEPIKMKEVKMKTLDYKIYIAPSDSFINDIISANIKEKQNKLSMQWCGQK